MKKYLFISFTFGFLMIFLKGISQDSTDFTKMFSLPFPGLELPEQSDDAGGKGISLEIAHGQAYTDWTDAWLWVFSGNCLYHFNKIVAAGAGAGLQFDNTGIYPWFSINSIFGNKVTGFAGSVDVNFIFSSIPDEPYERIWPTMGVYYKNFFIKYMPTFLGGYKQEHFIQLGYSYYIKF